MKIFFKRFYKLFISLLEFHYSSSENSHLKNLIKDQFEGKVKS